MLFKKKKLLGYTLHRKHNPDLPQAACQSSKRNRGAELTCGVPNLSIRGTRCRGAYFASSLFILTSSLSPSVVNTQMQAGSCTICTFGNSPHLDQSAHYLLSVTLLGYLWCKLWAGCSGRGRREAGHKLLPGTEIQTKRKEGHFLYKRNTQPLLLATSQCMQDATRRRWFRLLRLTSQSLPI